MILIRQRAGCVPPCPGQQARQWRGKLAALRRCRSTPLGRYEETQERLCQQQGRLAQCHAPALSGRYALLQGQVASYLGNWDEAGSGQDPLTLGQAYHVLAMERYWMGQPTQGSG